MIGDFIEIPAWNVDGLVVAKEDAIFGSDNAIRVKVQETPEGEGRWYHLEPEHYTILE